MKHAVIVATCAVAVHVVGSVDAQTSSALAPPVILEADGKPIDTGVDIGHPGPLVRDHDGDGKPDLLVSAFRGNIRFFKNVGSRAAPKFEEGEPVHAGGEPIRIHNW